MKQHLGAISATLMSMAILSVTLFFVGCDSGDEMEPDARIPNVPPSTRAADGGGVPGAAGAPGAAKAPK